MAEKPKKKSSKPGPDDKGVLAALPAQRPARIGGRRESGNDTEARPAAAATGAKPAAKASTSSETTRTAKASRAKAKPRAKAKAARRKAAAPRTFEPTNAAEAAAGDADERAAGLKPAPASRPRAVRAGAPGIGGGPDPEDRPVEPGGRPSGTDIAATAVKAAGELAQFGLTVGGKLIKRAVDRLPKP